MAETQRNFRSRTNKTTVDSIDEMLKERDGVLDELKLNLLCQQIIKQHVDTKRRDESFAVGDLVSLNYNHTGNVPWLTDQMRNYHLDFMGYPKWLTNYSSHNKQNISYVPWELKSLLLHYQTD